jgi:hypothetical protein
MSVDVDEWGPCLSPGALDGGIGVSEVCEVLVLSTVLLLLMYLMYRCWSSFPGIFVFPSTSTSTSTSTHVVPAKTILISNLLVLLSCRVNATGISGADPHPYWLGLGRLHT